MNDEHLAWDQLIRKLAKEGYSLDAIAEETGYPVEEVIEILNEDK